jgi:sulfide:quinone oxidoreductase
MEIKQVTADFSISDQVTVADLDELRASGVKILICNRPDQEAEDQPAFAEIAAAAEQLGIEAQQVAFPSGKLTPEHTHKFGACLERDKRIHAYCRTGTRSFTAYAALLASQGTDRGTIESLSKKLGFDVAKDIEPYFTETTMSQQNDTSSNRTFDVVIVGAGSGGIAAAASLKKRAAGMRIVLIDPASEHFYQPGWTMVGGGVFEAPTTRRDMQGLIPSGTDWIQEHVAKFHPADNTVELANGDLIGYGHLIVAPGLKLNWSAIDGLEETLGKNGVTSNYRYDLAPYTWELVQSLKQGKALFTQPPMPIKCAGAPQKAMYLSCDHWKKSGALKDIDVHFFNAGAVLFGVADYVPALQSYVDSYGADVHFTHTLTAIDGDKRIAHFDKKTDDGSEPVTMEFDMIHVCPPQCAPDFVADSELSDADGWLDVDMYTLQHKQFPNVWGLGDVMNTPNAKTMAAVRKQVPVVADNLMAARAGKDPSQGYDGYGSCPLTVENGKIVLAEFGYGGKLLPTFPGWLLKGTKATHTAWILKKQILPAVYWRAMLKGREWLAAPKPLKDLQQ